jgi:hypothetical protein
MSKRERRLKVIERRWLARFGEPPSLRTDPTLMLRILDGAGPGPRQARPGLSTYGDEPV